jgi:hypothetical protein
MDETQRTKPIKTAKSWQKYKSYNLSVDREQNDKATEIDLFTFARPHMRSFHVAWWSFFISFFLWFAIDPLLPDIQADLKITKKHLFLSNLASIGGTIVARITAGPLCDKYGARCMLAMTLIFGSLTTACIGLVHSAAGLIVIRTLIGFVGASFVMTEYWTYVSCKQSASCIIIVLSSHDRPSFLPSTQNLHVCQRSCWNGQCLRCGMGQFRWWVLPFGHGVLVSTLPTCLWSHGQGLAMRLSYSSGVGIVDWHCHFLYQ